MGVWMLKRTRGEGGRKDMLDDDTEEDEVGEGVKTGGQGGKVRDVNAIDEDELTEDGALNVAREFELDKLRLDDDVGMLRLKLEGKSKVMDDGVSGANVEYDR